MKLRTQALLVTLGFWFALAFEVFGDEPSQVGQVVTRLQKRIEALEESNANLQREIVELKSQLLSPRGSKTPASETSLNRLPSDAELMEAVNRQIVGENTVLIPIGTIEVMNVFESGLQTTQTSDTIYTQERFKALSLYEQLGLAQIRKIPQDELTFFRDGARIQYISSLTDKGRAATKPCSTNFAGLLLADAKVSKVFQVNRFTNPNYSASETCVIALLTYDYFPTEIGRQYYSLIPDMPPLRDKYKGKALLKYNPFTNTYRCEKLDWGHVDEEFWRSGNIP